MLTSQLGRMYDVEFSECLASSKLAMSEEEHQVLAILESSAHLVDDHYQLALPWCYRPPSLIVKGHARKVPHGQMISVANPCGTCHTTQSSTSTNLVKYEWSLIMQLNLVILH